MALSEQQSGELQRYFPVGCYFYWDGKGEVPIGSEIVYTQARMRGDTQKKVCQTCRCVDSCDVRMDRK